MYSRAKIPLGLIAAPFLARIVGPENNNDEDIVTEGCGGSREYTRRKLELHLRRKKATDMLNRYMEVTHVPGISAAVSVNGKIVYKRGFGYQDVANDVKCTGDMKGNIASITKLFLAYFTLRTLQDVPSFDVSKPVSCYLPNITKQTVKSNNDAMECEPPEEEKVAFTRVSDVKCWEQYFKLYKTVTFTNMQQTN